MGHRYTISVAALFVLATGCGGTPTEVERLRARLDTTSVHLYIAAKLAVADPDRVPEAAAARRKIVEATVASIPLVTAAAAGIHNRALPQAPAATVPEVRAGDVIVLARAVLALRSAGRAMLLDERDRTLPPVLPLLIADTPLAASLDVEIDANLEHALLLWTFFTLKGNSNSPVPLPPELLLYEASRTDAPTLALSGLRSTTHGIKAFVYGEADLCGLAEREGDAMPEALTAADHEAMRRDMTRLGADLSAFDAPAFARFHSSFRALAKGAVALCYIRRDDFARARPSLEASMTSAEAAGVPLAETAPVRAYLAYEAGDKAEAARLLRLARDNPRLGEAERARLDAVIGHLEASRGDALDAYFDRAFFALTLMEIALDAIARSGVDDAAERSPLAGALRGFVTYAAHSLEHLRASVPTVPTASDARASGVWAWITGLF